MWFVAHAVMSQRRLSGGQEEFLIWENMFLIEAVSEADAMTRAELFAKRDEGGPERGLEAEDGTPLEWVFEGVRKVIRCENENEAPVDGIELTWSAYRVASLSDAVKMAKGEHVRVEYIE